MDINAGDDREISLTADEVMPIIQEDILPLAALRMRKACQAPEDDNYEPPSSSELSANE